MPAVIPCSRWCNKRFATEIARERHLRVQEGACWEAYQQRLNAHAARDVNDAFDRPEADHGPGLPADEPMDWDPHEGEPMAVDDEGARQAGQGRAAAQPVAGLPGGGRREEEGAGDEDGDPWLQSLKKRYPGKHLIIKDDAATILPERNLTFLQRFASDTFAEQRNTAPYYPFRDRDEWELAEFLANSTLSMSALDEFLRLKLVRSLLKCFIIHLIAHYR